MLVGAAISPETAAWVGSWADALITIVQPDEPMRATLSAFREGGGRDKPAFLQAQHGYARTDEEALEDAYHQWRVNIFDSSVLAELRQPADFETAAEFITHRDLRGAIRISSSLEQHARWLQSYADLGFDRVYVHNVGRNQEEFIEAFGREVLPRVGGAQPGSQPDVGLH